MLPQEQRTSASAFVEEAWQQLRGELRGFLASRLPSAAPAVDDLLQDIFLRLQRRANELPPILDVRAWLFQITRNAFIDHQRFHALRKTVEMEDSHCAELVDPAVEIQRRLAPCLPVMIDELPKMYAGALRLVDLQSRSQTEAAKALGISLTAVKSRVRRGRERLKALLLDCCQFEISATGRLLDYWPRRCCSGSARQKRDCS